MKFAAGIVAVYVLASWLAGEGGKPSPVRLTETAILEHATGEDCNCLIPPNYGLYR